MLAALIEVEFAHWFNIKKRDELFVDATYFEPSIIGTTVRVSGPPML